MKNNTNLKLISSACLALVLTSCTTVNPYTGQNQVSNSTIGAGIGTATGAVLGSLVGGTRGALIGGAIGATTGGLIGHSMDQENEELRRLAVGCALAAQLLSNRFNR